MIMIARVERMRLIRGANDGHDGTSVTALWHDTALEYKFSSRRESKLTSPLRISAPFASMCDEDFGYNSTLSTEKVILNGDRYQV